MKNKHMFRGLAILAGIALGAVSFSPLAAQQSKLRIIQTNFAGDSIHIIDPATNKVVNEIKGFEATHGITVAPDGSRIYISSEDDFTLVVIDGKTLKVTKRIPLSGNPNLIDITPDGKQIYVAIAQNWTMPMDPAPSPMAVSKNPDGSTRSIFAQNGRDNGFQVVDFATRKITNTIKLPDITGQVQVPYGPPAASHGIMVTPDQKTLLVNSRMNSAVYAYSLPDLKPLGAVTLGGKGAGWMTITPDGKTAYVANEHTNNVSAVDIKTLKEVALIPVGFAPARNIIWMAP